MKKHSILILFSFFFSLLIISCSVKTPEAKKEHEEWIRSLNDSIKNYKSRITEDSIELSKMNDKTQILIEQFSYVNNPRQVEGYYIKKDWENKYPLKVTGMVARITENENLEVIATLLNKNFNQLKLTCGDKEVTTQTIAHDQALNYRAGNLNTVCFMGEDAASLGEFIKEHENSKIKIHYLGGNSPFSMDIPENEKGMIASTWVLYDCKKNARFLENDIRMMFKRISVCRQMMEHPDSLKN